jgi:hypothetical protein
MWWERIRGDGGGDERRGDERVICCVLCHVQSFSNQYDGSEAGWGGGGGRGEYVAQGEWGGL